MREFYRLFIREIVLRNNRIAGELNRQDTLWNCYYNKVILCKEGKIGKKFMEMSNRIAIEVNDLSKIYKIHKKEEGIGNTIKDLFYRKYIYKESVKRISFSIKEGEIIGLLGENGAGKTTTLKMLSGILYPTYGRVNVLGYNPCKRDKEFLKKICFVMGNKREINWDLPAIDTFNYQRIIYNIPKDEFNINLNEMVDMLNVRELLNIPLRRLSLGERMKMELINNFLYSPSIIFLDEPTLGLDLNSQIAIRQFIKSYATRKNATIIITSHYMDDIEETCERIILLDSGNKIYDGPISILTEQGVQFKEVIRKMMSSGESLKC